MIGPAELVVSRDHPELLEPVPPALRPNAERLLEVLRALDRSLSVAWGPGTYVLAVQSGYRPPALNAAVGGSPTSRHLLAAAADVTILARDGALAPAAVYTYARAFLEDLEEPLELLPAGTSIHVGLQEPPVSVVPVGGRYAGVTPGELLVLGLLLGVLLGARRG